MAMSMVRYISHRFLSSSGGKLLAEGNSAKHIFIKKNKIEKVQTFASKAEASSKELISDKKSSPIEVGTCAGRTTDCECCSPCIGTHYAFGSMLGWLVCTGYSLVFAGYSYYEDGTKKKKDG